MTAIPPGFLADILEHPADDTPRLVLADWLDEHDTPLPCPYCKDAAFDTGDYGGPIHRPEIARHVAGKCLCKGKRVAPGANADRAEFISVQCELAKANSEYLRWADAVLKGTDDGTAPSGAYEVLALRRRELALWDRAYDTMAGFAWFDLFGRGQRLVKDSPEIWSDDNVNVKAFVRRGFVSEVRLPLAAFLGICRTCRGHGRFCSGLCHGTGRVPGIAKALFACQPVEKVVLTNREPMGLNGEFVWDYQDDRAVGRHTLTRPLHELLTGARVTKPDNLIRYYPTRGAAQDALSAACVGYGRSLAGLGSYKAQVAQLG